VDFLTDLGLQQLWAQTKGVPEVRVAVLDGPVDLAHPVFAGAQLEVSGLFPCTPDCLRSPAGAHGTHVASLIFGRGEMRGLAPDCRGLLIPLISSYKRKIPQLDLARAIEEALEWGAHLITVSAGQYTDVGLGDDWLMRAVELCRQRNTLVVAAAGNDGCECLHVPACLPATLAVGALGRDGLPADFSNWGEAYRQNGILAPGVDIPGAVPGGGLTTASGTSFAVPLVSGVAALLLSREFQQGRPIDPLKVRAAILGGADPCGLADSQACKRYLVGQLNIVGAMHSMSHDHSTVTPQGCGCASPPSSESVGVAPSGVESSGVGGHVYMLGTLGYDFGTEARRDSFKQMMSPMSTGVSFVPPNPYDARQMVDYLREFPAEARSLIWTINLELTPIYALEPRGPFGADIYGAFRELLEGEIAAEDAPQYVERVSLPGRLTGRQVRLFSGQWVPVLEMEHSRGIYGWQVNRLISAALESVRRNGTQEADEAVQANLRGFLNRIYYDLRNLGVISHDRALNFAATNAFQVAETFRSAVADGMQLDTIDVERSPYCRLDSDCWDVKLKFFDPENTRRARRVFRFTIDVSDVVPVTLGEVRSWAAAN